jgi:hypothetical protein
MTILLQVIVVLFDVLLIDLRQIQMATVPTSLHPEHKKKALIKKTCE